MVGDNLLDFALDQKINTHPFTSVEKIVIALIVSYYFLKFLPVPLILN